LFFFLGMCFLIISARLFYWQILKHQTLAAEADDQHWKEIVLSAARGEILSSDNFTLVSNITAYNLFLDKRLLADDPLETVGKLLPLVFENQTEQASAGARLKPLLDNDQILWVKLFSGIGETAMELIDAQKTSGLVWQRDARRHYPEASAAAHVSGFVAADSAGLPKGYFGLEGYYNRELSGQAGKSLLEADATGNPIVFGQQFRDESHSGRTLLTHLDRTVQFVAKRKLAVALEKYGAKSGTVTVLEPKTGAVLAMVALPDYNPDNFGDFPDEYYANPIISQSFEPGSTFKVLVMAAAINEKLVGEQTVCPCNGPVVIPPYTISTWDRKYHQNSGIKEIIQYSDNVGMVFVEQKFEPETLVNYFRNFGFALPTGVDLEEESSPKLREVWREIDLATASFGQGIAATPLQMVNAVSALANGGWLMEPQVVDKIRIKNIEYRSQKSEVEEIDIEPKKMRRVVSAETAMLMTEIMVNAVKYGEAKWTAAKGYRIAGKTGTAQIPVEGHYDSEKTIASFVGFAPADDPKFVMLVTLREPETSPWGSETAAPLWFDIAKELFLHYGIAPSE
jgi:cell division protein FtsI/penicillin-binding protein 2